MDAFDEYREMWRKEFAERDGRSYQELGDEVVELLTKMTVETIYQYVQSVERGENKQTDEYKLINDGQEHKTPEQGVASLYLQTCLGAVAERLGAPIDKFANPEEPQEENDGFGEHDPHDHAEH